MKEEGDTEHVMVLRWFLAAAAVAFVVTPVDAEPSPHLDVRQVVDGLAGQEPTQVPAQVLDLVTEGSDDEPAEPAPPEPGREPGFADRVREAFAERAMAYSMLSGGAVLLGVGGFALVSRYISPKEALKNPQRAMLYGFIRATPGAHLKQLSDEFGMKTSSILWHIRKLESADLVKSDRVNGYRVFYPCEGGIEVRRVSRAMAALQNDNALRVYEHLNRHPGGSARLVAERLSLHGGTARWHLRKLREHGLLDELLQEDGSRFYPTPLGNRALEAREGRPIDAPRPAGRPVPSD